MRKMKINKAFTLMESGPVVLVTTNDGKKNNIMTIVSAGVNPRLFAADLSP